GEFTELSATLATRRPLVKIAKTDESLPATSPDQVTVHGTLQSGAVASFHFRGGQSRGTNLLWEINGTDGDLVVTGAGGHVQMLELTLQGRSEEHTSELQSLTNLVCRLLLEKKKNNEDHTDIRSRPLLFSYTLMQAIR